MEADALAAWLDYLGVAPTGDVAITGYLTQALGGPGDAIRGWGTPETPNLVANSSDKEARVPGLVRPHHVTVHPSPSLKVAVGWLSPVAARVTVSAEAIDAHADCGNGFDWALEVRRGGDRRRLAEGVVDSGKAAKVGPFADLDVRPGDLVSLLIGPRDGNHGCDLTEVHVTIAVPGDDSRTWSLARDVADDVHAGNPHADRRGLQGIWHFYTEPTSGQGGKPVIPPGSLLARWRDAKSSDEKHRLAGDLQKLLSAPPNGDGPDAALARQVVSLNGPVFGRVAEVARADPASLGIKPLAAFGKRPDGTAIDPADLCVRAPSTVEFRVPTELVAGAEFAAQGTLDPAAGAHGSVQFAATGDPARLMPGEPVVALGAGRKRFEADLGGLRRVFPAAVWYGQIVPVDEVITIILFHREDEPLVRLVLDDAERKELDRLWDELRFVSQDALKIYQSFDLMLGFASQEGDAARLIPQQKLAAAGAEALNRRLVASEPRQIDALIRVAARAYRRPLALDEEEELRGLYRKLRHEKLSHDEAFRLTLARVLVSPAFLYRAERPGPGAGPSPVSDWELASRLSYFLWASTPDEELSRLAGSGRLHDPAVLAAQARRMVRDDRARALATEFACQWLEIRDFDKLDEKSEKHFPTFAAVRGDLHEQAVRTFADLFGRDGSVLELIDSNHAFLNENLAKHYGIPGVAGPGWRRVEGVRKYGLGGVLGLGATLAKHSGASRTSPILRGNWVVETLLGERLPKPPKGVPTLPEDEASTEGADGPPARREAPGRPGVRRLSRPDRPLRLRPRRLRHDRPPAQEGPRRPPDRRPRHAPRRHRDRRRRRPPRLPREDPPRRLPPQLLPQAPRLRARPVGRPVGRATDRRDARGPPRPRFPVLRGAGDDRPQQALPRAPRPPGVRRPMTRPGAHPMAETRVTRRTMLRGLGVTMALPWLESLPARAPARRRRPGRPSAWPSSSRATAITAPSGRPRARGSPSSSARCSNRSTRSASGSCSSAASTTKRL